MMPRISSMPIAYSRSSPVADPMPDTVVCGPVQATYPDRVNPRARRIIVSGVLIGLVVIVVIAALWNGFG